MLRAGDKKLRNWQTLGMQLSMGTKFIRDTEVGNGERKTRNEGGKEDSVMSHWRYREDKCLGHIKDHTSPLVITFHDPYKSPLNYSALPPVMWLAQSAGCIMTQSGVI